MTVGRLVVNAHQVRDIASQIVCESNLNRLLGGDVTDAEHETFVVTWFAHEAFCRAGDAPGDSDTQTYWDRITSDFAPSLFPGRADEGLAIRYEWDRRLTSAFEQFHAGNGGAGLDEAGVTNMRVVLFDLRAENGRLIADHATRKAGTS